MFRVERTYNGTKGFKDFATLEEAMKWLQSDDVKQDQQEGFQFHVIEMPEIY